MTFGLTAAGFKTMRLPNIKSALDDAMIAQFGDIDLQPGTTVANLIAPFSQIAATVWENMDDVYQSQYPASAYGTSLDRIVQINGIKRLSATQTQVQCVCQGQEGAGIQAGSQVQIPATGEIFSNPLDGVITQRASVYDRVQVQSLQAQAYILTIDGIQYFYSLPQIVFDIDFVTGNSISITINENQLTAVVFDTDQATTMSALVTQIETLDSVASVSITGSNKTLTIIPSIGFQNTVDNVQITGGLTQPTVSYAFGAPSTYNNVTSNLCAIINAANVNITAVDNSNHTFDLTSSIVASKMTPFNLVNGSNLSVIQRSSQITFYSENYGQISAPVNSLTQIVTPTYGWDSVNNVIAGITGRNIETDSELRIRRKNSILVIGAGTVEAIRARLLQFVPDVSENGVSIFENTTMFQEDGFFTLNSDLISGDSVVVILNLVTLTTVTYATSHLATMTVLAGIIALQPNVKSAVVGGNGNRTITIEWNSATINVINSVTINPSSDIVFIENGRPPKSFEAVVQGGLDQDIGEQIWLTKPAGIESYGNVEVTVVDSEGNDHAIFFSRPADLYLWVEVVLTLDDSGTFPSNGVNLVQEAIKAYGDALEIGQDVYFQRVLSQIFNVTGIASGDMQIAVTNLPTSTPSYSTSNITIDETSISVWDLGRIMVTVA